MKPKNTLSEIFCLKMKNHETKNIQIFRGQYAVVIMGYKLVYLSDNFLPPQPVKLCGRIQFIPIRDRIVPMAQRIVWKEMGELERQATWAGTTLQGKPTSDFTRHAFKMK